MISDSKQEILKTIPDNTNCSYSFLNSLFSSAKTEYSSNFLQIDLSLPLMIKSKTIINNFYKGIKCEIGEKFSLYGDVEQLLLDLGIQFDAKEHELKIDGINQELVNGEESKIAFLKGLYLVAGNFYYTKNNNVKSSGYSVEFVFKNFALADDTKALLRYLKLKATSIKRGNNIVVYIKNSNSIYDFFLKLGAIETAIEIQNNLVIREIRNETNRQGNCFDANLNKTINASGEQVKAIDFIISNYGIDFLDKNLQEVALLRLANTDITLNEMQKLYSQPITRAGLKYKLDKIIKIYKDLKTSSKNK